jgi:mannose/fructose/N-acetylgalactosamine-specific phosphotransferase system component IIB
MEIHIEVKVMLNFMVIAKTVDAIKSSGTKAARAFLIYRFSKAVYNIVAFENYHILL